MNDEVIRDLARRAGIAVEWSNYAGAPRVVAIDVLRHILDALGLPSATRGDLLTSRRLLQRRNSVETLPPLITATAGRPTRLLVGTSEVHTARLSLENGEARDITLTTARGRLRVPAISETGYHRLLVGDRDIVGKEHHVET